MSLIEKRYAEALVDISVQKGMIDAYQEEFKDLVDLYNTHSDLKLLLINPQIKAEAKKELITKLYKNKMKTELLNFVLLLIDKGRIKFLPSILDEYIQLANKHKNILDMTIISAAPLEDTQINALKEKYKALYNSSAVKANIEVDSSLIGGVKVRIGDKVIDGTVKGRLDSLKQLIIEN